MEANELRIGNLFIDKYSKQIIPVLELLRSGNIVFDIECFGMWQAEPIPLTEEWLWKFGSVSSFTSDPQEQQASKKFVLGEITIHMPNEDVQYFMISLHDVLEIKYVHQLQNLYFALTGEELTIK